MGATASKDDGPLETLDADQVRDVVAGFGTQFAGAADKREPCRRRADYSSARRRSAANAMRT